MQTQCNEYYETSRLRQIAEDAPRMLFIGAVRNYGDADCPIIKTKMVEAIVRTSRTVTNDEALLPDDIQAILMNLIENFRDFGPTVVSVPTSYSQARNLIKTFFF